jgi:hypothetical protein
MYTIVSKPVERFEIILGRFFGYGGMMTVALLLMVFISVIYIGSSKFNPKAVEETYKARVTVRGKLSFRAYREGYEGTNVGREFEYRKYIGGSPQTRERAIWSFDEVPANLTRKDRASVPLEYTLDIFRLTKGDENRGVDINIRVCSWQTGQRPSEVRGDGVWRWTDQERADRYEKERQEINNKLKAGGYGPGYDKNLDYAKPGTKTWELVDNLAKVYGFYEIPSVEVYDFQPGSVPIPTGLFENAAEGDAVVGEKKQPRVQVYVKCMSHGQMLGMAEGDLYFIEGQRAFWENYFKSSFGLWCRMLIVIGLAVTFSTYFAAMIAVLGTAMMYGMGYLAEFIQDIGNRSNVGGGPMESSIRMIRGETPTMPFEATGALQAVNIFDEFFAWIFRRVMNVIPDVDAFAWSDFLGEGYNVNFEHLVVNLLMLVGYLLPWGVLAYYLMRNREVAA